MYFVTFAFALSSVLLCVSGGHIMFDVGSEFPNEIRPINESVHIFLHDIETGANHSISLLGKEILSLDIPEKVNSFRINYVRSSGTFRSDIFQSEVFSSSNDYYVLGDNIPYSVHLADGRSLGSFTNTNAKWPGWRETTIRCYGYLSHLYCDLTNYGVQFQTSSYEGGGIGANVAYAGYADYCEWFEWYLQHGCLTQKDATRVYFATVIFYADVRFYNNLPQTCNSYLCSDCGWTPHDAYYLKADLGGVGIGDVFGTGSWTSYAKTGPGVEERLSALIKLKRHEEL
jgi:hypothetical protein